MPRSPRPSGSSSRLIEESAGEFDIRLTLVGLDAVPRGAEAREAMSERYRSARQLRASSPDAIIVTGAEPRAARLEEEPYWSELTSLIDWSRHGVISALYSCLAAHAAALHGAGIVRRRLWSKCSGVYESEVIVRHELTEGLTKTLTPHSRLNALAECDLEFKGYLILSRSSEAGADVVVREKDGLEVFWQGHPEYDRDTLAREFRRDMLRYLGGEREKAPHLPAHYFDAGARARIAAALERAAGADIEAVAAALSPEALSPAEAEWRGAAVTLTRNWLKAIARRRAEAWSAAEVNARRYGG